MKSLPGVSAAILAGGLGTRLRPIVGDQPKVLADVGGKPFLAYLLDQLSGYGIRVAVLCTGYRADEVRTRFGENHGSLRLVYSRESSPLGTAGALRLALPFLESESVIILNGDSYCDVDLQAFCDWYSMSCVDAGLILTALPDTGRYGRVRTDEAGRVMAFEEKSGDGGPGWVNAGIYAVRRSLLRTIPTGCKVSLERDIFPVWTRLRFYSYRHTGIFLDIGTPESYSLASRCFPLQKGV